MPRWAKWGIALLAGVLLVWAGYHVPYLLVTLHILVCLLLISVIMLQSGQAADLAGAFGGAGSQTAFGPRGATTFLSRATTWCAIVFMMTSLTLSVQRSHGEPGGAGSIIEQTQQPAKPAAPAKTSPAAQHPFSPPAQTPPSAPAPSAPAQKVPAPSAPAPAKK